VNKNFWKNKSVLVTGYEGFLGSNLTRRLVDYRAKVVGIDIRINRKETILTKDDYKKIIVIKGNVARDKLLKEIMQKYNTEVVFHLAAEAIVGRCLRNPTLTFSSNILGTWNLLDCCRDLNTVKAIIVASSDKAYGIHEQLPYKENASLRGSHPYDVSKSCADLIAYTYFHTYGLPVAITRCGNIYGPGDFNFSRIVPDAIRCAVSDKALLVRSDGKFTRDYVYVDDIVNGCILLAEKLQELKLAGEAFNFSNENPLTIIGLINKIYGILKKRPDYKILNQAKYEIRHQYLCSRKARRILRWRPRYGLEEGLKKTIQWYKRYV
jgi:CDP-glucose 4,6-dehydratase